MVKLGRWKGIDFPILDDPGNRIADELDAVATPHTYVIDAKGKLCYSGAVCDNWQDAANAKKKYLKSAIDAVLDGKPVSEPSPEAFIGCSIKRVQSAG